MSDAPPILNVTIAPVFVHNLSDRHRKALMLSHTCGCFYCLETFNWQEVTEWIDDGCTALCPRCGIDSVLPSHWIQITETLLKQMHELYFGPEHTHKLGELPPREDLGDGWTGDLE